MPNELEQILKKDHIMGHTMGALMGDEPDYKPGDDLDVPNERGMINIWAIAMWAYLKYLQDPTITPDIYFTGAHLYGDDLDRAHLGQVMSDAMVKKLQEHHIPGRVTTVTHFVDVDGQIKPVVDTYGEVQAYLNIARNHKFTKGGTVAAVTHTTSINMLFDRYDDVPGLNAHSFAAETILQLLPKELQTKEYLDAIHRVFHSNEEVMFFLQEAVKAVFYSIPGGAGERYINRKAQESRNVSNRVLRVNPLDERTIEVPKTAPAA